jgi:hypothetical protein
MSGRPAAVPYSEEVTDEICRRIAEGESLRRICSEEDMPKRRTVFDWLDAYEEFRTKYARAREWQAETHVDEMQDIADDARNDWMEVNDPDNPGFRLNGEHIQRSKVRLEQRRWYAEKLLPKKYGLRQHIEHSGTVSIADALREAKEKRRGEG